MTARDFHARRRTGIGGSDVGAILGAPGAYHTAYAVWLQKTGQAEPAEATPLMDLGNLLEPAILLHGGLTRPGGFVRHPEHDWMLGHTDGYAGDVVLEGKALVYSEAPSLSHELQLRWYMAITDAPAGRLVWADLPRTLSAPDALTLVQAQTPEERLEVLRSLRRCELHIRDVPRDLEIERAIIARVSEWRQRYLIDGELPEPDGSDEAGRHLREVYGEPSAEWREAPDAEALVREYIAAGEAERAAAARKKTAAQQIQALIGDHAGLTFPSGRVGWSRYTQRRLDEKRLRAEHPEIVEAYQKEIQMGRLNPKIED